VRFISLAAATAAIVASLQIASAQSKVAYVDIDRVTAQSKEVNSAMGSMQGKVKKIQDDLEAKRKKIAELNADLKKTEGLVSAEEQNRKKREIQTLQNEAEDLQMSGRREMQRLDDTFFEPMLKRIVFAIEDVARDRDLDLVVRGEAVLYGADSVNITEDVIKKLNSQDSSTTATRRTTTKSTPAPAESDNTPAAGTAAATAAAPAEAAATPKPAETTPASTPRARSTGAPRAGTRPVDRQPD